mmetsp:Transcript_30842/g.49459  ORF Transcript_30842/g.49459 Transcript_30842/m.49459 type:complete len:1327 (-) Transcript_30842:7-3987(-)
MQTISRTKDAFTGRVKVYADPQVNDQGQEQDGGFLTIHVVPERTTVFHVCMFVGQAVIGVDYCDQLLYKFALYEERNDSFRQLAFGALVVECLDMFSIGSRLVFRPITVCSHDSSNLFSSSRTFRNPSVSLQNLVRQVNRVDPQTPFAQKKYLESIFRETLYHVKKGHYRADNVVEAGQLVALSFMGTKGPDKQFDTSTLSEWAKTFHPRSLCGHSGFPAVLSQALGSCKELSSNQVEVFDMKKLFICSVQEWCSLVYFSEFFSCNQVHISSVSSEPSRLHRESESGRISSSAASMQTTHVHEDVCPPYVHNTRSGCNTSVYTSTSTPTKRRRQRQRHSNALVCNVIWVSINNGGVHVLYEEHVSRKVQLLQEHQRDANADTRCAIERESIFSCSFQEMQRWSCSPDGNVVAIILQNGRTIHLSGVVNAWGRTLVTLLSLHKRFSNLWSSTGIRPSTHGLLQMPPISELHNPSVLDHYCRIEHAGAAPPLEMDPPRQYHTQLFGNSTLQGQTKINRLCCKAIVGAVQKMYIRKVARCFYRWQHYSSVQLYLHRKTILERYYAVWNRVIDRSVYRSFRQWVTMTKDSVHRSFLCKRFLSSVLIRWFKRMQSLAFRRWARKYELRKHAIRLIHRRQAYQLRGGFHAWVKNSRRLQFESKAIRLVNHGQKKASLRAWWSRWKVAVLRETKFRSQEKLLVERNNRQVSEKSMEMAYRKVTEQRNKQIGAICVFWAKRQRYCWQATYRAFRQWMQCSASSKHVQLQSMLWKIGNVFSQNRLEWTMNNWKRFTHLQCRKRDAVCVIASIVQNLLHRQAWGKWTRYYAFIMRRNSKMEMIWTSIEQTRMKRWVMKTWKHQTGAVVLLRVFKRKVLEGAMYTWRSRMLQVRTIEILFGYRSGIVLKSAFALWQEFCKLDNFNILNDLIDRIGRRILLDRGVRLWKQFCMVQMITQSAALCKLSGIFESYTQRSRLSVLQKGFSKWREVSVTFFNANSFVSVVDAIWARIGLRRGFDLWKTFVIVRVVEESYAISTLSNIFDSYAQSEQICALGNAFTTWRTHSGVIAIGDVISRVFTQSRQRRAFALWNTFVNMKRRLLNEALEKLANHWSTGRWQRLRTAFDYWTQHRVHMFSCVAERICGQLLKRRGFNNWKQFVMARALEQSWALSKLSEFFDRYCSVDLPARVSEAFCLWKRHCSGSRALFALGGIYNAQLESRMLYSLKRAVLVTLNNVDENFEVSNLVQSLAFAQWKEILRLEWGRKTAAVSKIAPQLNRLVLKEYLGRWECFILDGRRSELEMALATCQESLLSLQHSCKADLQVAREIVDRVILKN